MPLSPRGPARLACGALGPRLEPHAARGSGGGRAEGLNGFILANLTEPELRAARVAALSAHARPFSYPHFERLLSTGNVLSKSVD